MEATFWQGDEVRKVDLTYVHEPFGLAGFLGHIRGTVWPTP